MGKVIFSQLDMNVRSYDIYKGEFMKNREIINSIIEKYGTGKGVLIPLLQDVQETEGYLSRETMQYVADKTGIGAADI